MSTIVLTTLNARYFHSSLGLRYLYANLGDLQTQAQIQEYIINQRPLDIAEKILAAQPRIVGIGVYIWNIQQSSELISILRRLSPELVIIVGGPEASYEQDSLPFLDQVDHVIAGQADRLFAEVCQGVLKGQPPAQKLLAALPFKLHELQLPYRYYSDEDIRQRLIYVEASRGCPFKCEFCLSALDKTAWPFELDRFLGELEALYRRGTRHFKFVDRTFNLKIASSLRIMEFFLQRMDENLFLHFELIPDHLPEPLKQMIQNFPAGSLQFEIGIQSFNPEVQQLISRRQDNALAEANIRFLREQSQAHLHTDLIAGLPGENLDSFGAGFDRLIALDPHEIQVGSLKRLRGAPIARHTETYQLVFNPHPPYNILRTRDIDFSTMQQLNRFARYWDLIGNSGRFRATRALLLGDAPFARFMRLSDWLYAETGQTHQLALPRLFRLVYQCGREVLQIPEQALRAALREDYTNSGMKGEPELEINTASGDKTRASSLSARQSRHA